MFKSQFIKIMKYKEFENAFSAARLNKYLYACNGNRSKALQLYRLNNKLCQKLYGVLNVFEVVLRNAIYEHYKTFFSDSDWIRSQLTNVGMLSSIPKNNEIASIIQKLVNTGKYTPNRVVSSLSFGFWTHLFTKYPFSKGGKSILKIFPNKTKPLGQRAVFNELMKIKEFRNRIAHHEPICFDKAGHVDTIFARSHYMLILRYLYYLGYNDSELLYGLDAQPDRILQNIDKLAEIRTRVV